MKKLILTTIAALSIATSVHAGQQNSLGGLIIGAGSGALMGQAIGRDTESTLVGTAVGSVLGYIIGNEMDKDSRVYYHPGPRRPAPHRPVVHHEKHVTTHHYHYVTTKPARPPKRHCKEAEILGTVHGKAKKFMGPCAELIRDGNSYPRTLMTMIVIHTGISGMASDRQNGITGMAGTTTGYGTVSNKSLRLLLHVFRTSLHARPQRLEGGLSSRSCWPLLSCHI